MKLEQFWLKKDKKIGENMSLQNAKFKDLLAKNIKLALSDIKNDNFEEIDLVT